jgi:hypothetical protein
VPLLLGACSSDLFSAPEPVGEPGAHPHDVTHDRIRTIAGDRFAITTGEGPAILQPSLDAPAEGDWAYNVGGQVNGGPALAPVGLAQNCSDRLIVPVNRSGNFNLFGFDRLYPIGGTCTNTTGDALCSPSPAPSNWCPRRAWRVQLDGAMNRNSVALNSQATRAYVATTTGKIYSIDVTNGATQWIFDTRVAGELGAASGATFEGVTPWVDYISYDIFFAVSYNSHTRTRLYKVRDNGTSVTKLSHLDIGSAALPDGVRAGVIQWNGYVYVSTTNGRIHKVTDGATLTAFTTAPWPVQLYAMDEAGGNYQQQQAAILGSPSIDAGNDLLFTVLNNVGYTVTIGGTGGTVQSVEMGWTTPQEAEDNNFPCYSSPYLVVGVGTAGQAGTMFIAHSKDQGLPQDERNRVHRREYSASGAFNMGNLTSIETFGNNNSMDDPKSSPIYFQPNPAVATAYVYVGDGGGSLNRWNYTPAAAFTNRLTFTPANNVSRIESPVVIDYTAGNIYFGNSTRIYQISQTTLQ